MTGGMQYTRLVRALLRRVSFRGHPFTALLRIQARVSSFSHTRKSWWSCTASLDASFGLRVECSSKDGQHVWAEWPSNPAVMCRMAPGSTLRSGMASLTGLGDGLPVHYPLYPGVCWDLVPCGLHRMTVAKPIQLGRVDC